MTAPGANCLAGEIRLGSPLRSSATLASGVILAMGLQPDGWPAGSSRRRRGVACVWIRRSATLPQVSLVSRSSSPSATRSHEPTPPSPSS